MKRVEPEDWTPERVTAFWDYWHQQEHLRSTYFSQQVGRGVVNYLRRQGVLGGKVLDFGCGSGALAAHLLRARAECWGCDSSPASVRTANESLATRPGWRGAGVVGDPRASYYGRTFDLVTCLETIEHVSEKEEGHLFADLRDVTKVGGLIFLTTPNDEDLSVARSNVYCPFCDSVYHHCQHVRAFDKSSLTSTIEAHGFRVRQVATVHFGCYQIPPWPGAWNVNLRYLAQVAMSIPGCPASALYRRVYTKLPHLCALAVRES